MAKGLRYLVALFLASSGGASYARYLEPQWVETVRLVLPLPRLPDPFVGIMVAHISDLHVGPLVSSDYIYRTLRWVMQNKPDVIFITGDFISRDSQLTSEVEAVLSALSAPLGVYSVLGNHDHWNHPQRVQTMVTAAGISVLRNEHTFIEKDGKRLWLLGVDDAYVGADDLGRTLRGVPEDAVKILLVHEPDFADIALEQDIALQLSGHSHGGQVRLPLIGPPLLPYLGRKYPAGLYQVGKGYLYTNRGLGMIAPAVRINCRPEVTFITLTRTSAETAA